MNSRQKELLQRELNNENKTIKELKQVYEQALIDCNTKIMELSMRTDMQNLQSIVYQKQYQEAIKGQLEGVLAQLNSNQFATVSEYLNDCYINGFVGNMYDLAGQGIPMIVPINQNQVAKAIQTDSKLSKSLYSSLGENVQYLKTAVRAQVSRGIANGSTWNEIAQHLAGNFKNTPFDKAINNTIRIARTEGHRVQNAAKMDAMNAAKEKGADIVKQWDSTMDNRTRDSHRKLHGQIREIDEPFEVWGKKADAPSHFGDPSEDINCRCAVLQRAKWALSDEELDEIEKKAEESGIVDVKSLEEFNENYLKAANEGADSGSVRSIEQKINGDFAKASTRYLNHNDKLYEYASKIKPEEGFEDVVVHGDPYSLVFRDADGNESNVSVKEFCEILEKDPNYKGGNIRLVSCETAAEPEIIPKYIADYFGVDVMASTEIVNVDIFGNIILANSEEDAKMGIETGEWKIYHPKSGRK